MAASAASNNKKRNYTHRTYKTIYESDPAQVNIELPLDELDYEQLLSSNSSVGNSSETNTTANVASTTSSNTAIQTPPIQWPHMQRGMSSILYPTQQQTGRVHLHGKRRSTCMQRTGVSTARGNKRRPGVSTHATCVPTGDQQAGHIRPRNELLPWETGYVGKEQQQQEEK